MRQHLVLQALLVKLQDPAMLPRIPVLIATLQDVMRTTIPVGVQGELIAMIPELSSEDLAFTTIDQLRTPSYTDGGAWIYQGDWATLPGYVEDRLAGGPASADEAKPGRTGRGVASKRPPGLGGDVEERPRDESPSCPPLAPESPLLA